jgi:RNA polymerase sigma-70 factor (ECF subfamily)
MTPDADFDRFYREVYPRLWAFLVRTTREPDLAEEVTQEAFVRLLASRGAALRGTARCAYLFRIAENLVRDAGRHRIRSPTTPLENVPEPVAPEPHEPMSRRVAAALEALSERERKLLWLAHVEGWPHADIAAALGLATGSIRVLLHRARVHFRQRFAEEEADEPKE